MVTIRNVKINRPALNIEHHIRISRIISILTSYLLFVKNNIYALIFVIF